MSSSAARVVEDRQLGVVVFGSDTAPSPFSLTGCLKRQAARTG